MAIVEIKKETTPFGPPLEIRFFPDELIKALTLMPKSLVEVGEYFYMQVFENMEKEWLSNYWIQTDHHSLASMAPADPLRYIATNKGVL